MGIFQEEGPGHRTAAGPSPMPPIRNSCYWMVNAALVATPSHVYPASVTWATVMV